MGTMMSSGSGQDENEVVHTLEGSAVPHSGARSDSATPSSPARQDSAATVHVLQLDPTQPMARSRSISSHSSDSSIDSLSSSASSSSEEERSAPVVRGRRRKVLRSLPSQQQPLLGDAAPVAGQAQPQAKPSEVYPQEVSPDLAGL